MSTLLAFHAHPDDEAISMGGTLAAAVDAGHRVVLVVATRGELGEVREGFLPHGVPLEEVREHETRAAARILGIHRVVFLGYRDSGMMGTDGNQDPRSFWRADLEEAAGRLASILRDEGADVLTVYDEHGGYGHPDHIQVHRVGHRAARLARTPRVYEATMNRDQIRTLIEAAREAGDEVGPEDEDASDFGMPDAVITTAVDVSGLIGRKRMAMQAHASQIDEESWFLSMPDDAFGAAFGAEWFIRVTPPFEGDPVRERETALL